MVSLEIIREFMLPYYKRFTDFLRGRGVEIILSRRRTPAAAPG